MAGAATGLERALLASLALHAAALFGFSLTKDFSNREIVAPEPIAAHLVELAPVAAPQETPAAANVVAKRSPKAKPSDAVEKAVETKSLPVATPAPVLESSPAAAVAIAPADPTTINHYRVQLLGAAGRFKRYPEAARENNWTGDVVVGVAVDAGGAAQVGLRRGSGHAVLDQQALEMFRQAARAVPVPEMLRGREFSLDVRAVYGLED
ncbi:MAG TPA: TonB family protein [Burkholderiales bacterium]